MIEGPQILLRTQQAPSEVGQRLAAALELTPRREVNLRVILEGRFTGAAEAAGSGVAGSGPAGGSAGDADRVSVPVDTRWPDPLTPALLRGYDTALTVVWRTPRDDDTEEAATVRLFAAVCRAMAVPALLVSAYTVVVAAWTPRLGLRRFPGGVDSDEAGRAQWGDYAQPPATPVEYAPGDTVARLHARIVADPDPDEPRLAYADAVEPEHPEHARLIRTQIAYLHDRRAGLDWEPGRFAELVTLEQSLHDALRPRRYFALLGRAWEVHRGFVETAALPAAVFVRHAGQLIGQVPLRMVYLTEGVAGELDALADSPYLARLVGLSLWGSGIGDAGLARLTASPHLGRLRWLSLVRTGVTAAGLEALAASDALPELRYVRTERDLALYPATDLDYDGTPVYTTPGPLGEALARRYDRAWLRWGQTARGRAGDIPAYDEV